jgi:tetratricopeptide (TPR) repeat protein
MVSKPFVIALASILGGSLGVAQSASSALVDKTQPKPPAATRTLTAEERGDIMMARKMYREAIDAFNSDPQKSAVLYNKIGIAYHQLQQLDNARKNYERALKLKRDYAEALNNIGTVYYAKKSYRRAISYYSKALRLSPNSASIYSNLGTALFARKKYELATDAYQKALAIDPEVFERRSNYGTMLEDRNIADRAKFHYYLAKMYAKSGRNDMALQYVRKALEEGFKDKKKLEEDPEFQALRNLPEFKDLLAAEPRVL